MVPASFFPYFATMAVVGAVLFGFVFLVLSIVPQRLVNESAPMGQQAKAVSAHYAFLHPLLISLVALIPEQPIGVAVFLMSLLGFLSTLWMGQRFLRHQGAWRSDIEQGAFLLSALVIFGLEITCALLLTRFPGNGSTLDTLTSVLVVSYLFGLARAWELISIRPFPLSDVFATWRENMPKSVLGSKDSSVQNDSFEGEKGTKQDEMAVWWMK